MPNFCTRVMQTVLKQKSEIFPDGILKIILGNGLRHIFLIHSKCIISLIFYHEKYHFLLELLSYTLQSLRSAYAVYTAPLLHFGLVCLSLFFLNVLLHAPHGRPPKVLFCQKNNAALLLRAVSSWAWDLVHLDPS